MIFTMPHGCRVAALYVAALLCVACAAFSQTQPKYLNLLAGTGDFDSDWSGDGIPDHWEATWNSSVFTPVLVTQNPHHGRRCQKVTISKNDSSSYSFNLMTSIKTASVLRPGSRLRVTFWWRANGVQNVDWKVWQNYHLSDGSSGYREVQRQTMLTNEETWKEWIGEFTVPEDATRTAIGIYLLAKAGQCSGEFYLDDLVVTDGRLEPQEVYKPMKMVQLYGYHQDWLTTALLFDSAQWHAWHYAEAVNDVHPEFLGMQMVRTAYILNDYGASPENPFTYQWLLANHPDWFLRDTSGNIITAGGESSMDVGMQAYRDALSAKLTDMASRSNWDAVFLDGFSTDRIENTVAKVEPGNYPTDASWHNAITGMFQALQPLRGMGVKLVANIAHGVPGEEPLTTWMNLLDGICVEWGFGMQDWDGSPLYPSYEGWKDKLHMLIDFPDKVVIMGQRMPDDWVTMRRFSMASYLCGMEDNCYFGYVRRIEESVWMDEFTAPIGRPVGTYRVVAGTYADGGLFKRTFTNGVVVVNPTEDQTFFWPLDGTYQDLDGNVVEPGVKVLGPRDSLIVLKAPRLILTISASPTQAAPGETVVYQVQYTNIGTATATNTYISAPVPTWTTFFSATGGGVYDPIENRVVWNLASVAPSGTGTVTFRVKVK